MLLLLFRLTAGRLVGVIRREFAAPHYVMVVGTGERAVRLARGARRVGRVWRPAARLPERAAAVGPTEIALERGLPGAARSRICPPCCGSTWWTKSSSRWAARAWRDLEEVFLLCDEEGVRTRVAVDFFPHVNSTVSLDRFGDTPLLTFSAAPHDEIRLLVKRVIDVADRGGGAGGAVAVDGC